MNKFSSASVALILAIPAGFLSYLLVDAMLIHFRNMATVMRILTCITLAFSALGTVLPVGIVIFTKTETEEDAETEADEDAKEGEEEDGEASEEGEEAAAEDTEGIIPSDDGDPVPDEEPIVVIDAFKDAESESIARPDADDADEDMEKSVVIETTGMFDQDIYESEPADDDLALDVEDEEPEPEPQQKDKKKKKKKK